MTLQNPKIYVAGHRGMVGSAIVRTLQGEGGSGACASPVASVASIITRTRARNPHVAVVVAGMQMPLNMGLEFARDFAAVFPEVARKQEATLIPSLLASVAGIPELNQGDQIHPTAAGHALVASNVWTVLEPVLRKQSSGAQ